MTASDTKTILVVDDDDGVRSLVRAVLRRHGHNVETARDGAEALKKIREEAYSLILLDLMMPKIDGLEVMRKIEDEGITSHALIVVMTAADDSLIAQLDRRRVHGVIRKPFDIEELAEIVTESISVRDRI
ncbi:MAG: response regulator [Acidobacteria bacterium]|nr:response regulator [Acidobacteriota bacterium]